MRQFRPSRARAGRRTHFDSNNLQLPILPESRVPGGAEKLTLESKNEVVHKSDRSNDAAREQTHQSREKGAPPPPNMTVTRKTASTFPVFSKTLLGSSKFPSMSWTLGILASDWALEDCAERVRVKIIVPGKRWMRALTTARPTRREDSQSSAPERRQRGDAPCLPVAPVTRIVWRAEDMVELCQ